MSDVVAYSLNQIFPFSVAGEWGTDPAPDGNAYAIRAADFTKDCKLRKEIGAPREIPKAKLGTRVLCDGDILIEKSGGSPDQPVGRPVYFDRESESRTYVHSNFLQLLRSTEGFDRKFLHYLLVQLYESGFFLRYQQQTTGIINLKLEELLRERVDVPPEKTQRFIRTVLCAADQAIEKTEALIEKYQQIKAGLMHDLFTRGVGKDGKLRPPREQAPALYQETPIGWIPKDWQYELLDKLTIRGSGHTPNKNISSYWNGGVKWVSLADSNKLDQLWISQTTLEISLLGVQNSSAVIHPAGTVVMTRDAGVGKSAILQEPMAVSQHFMAWRCGEKMNNHFLYHWLQYNKRSFENVAMGSTIVTIGLPYFKKLMIGAPKDPTEQKEIGLRLTTSYEYIKTLEKELRKLNCLKSGLMTDLFSGTDSSVDLQKLPSIA